MLCPSCRYTRTIPPQQDAANRTAWKKLEQAKRLLLYSLNSLGLSPPDRAQQPDTGLTFDFLTQFPNQPAVLTAHTAGVITINISEADDAQRERRRASLNEPYRTVLGHLRHEVGHFYWYQLVANSEYLDRCRIYFGDERSNYDIALQNYYRNAQTSDNWRNQYISRYASSHPWEDWAETWAYYLHIRDALDTAAAWKVKVHDINMGQRTRFIGDSFHQQLTAVWPQLCEYVNAMLHCAGVDHEYPSYLPEAVAKKIAFIHQVVTESVHQSTEITAVSGSQYCHGRI